MTHGHRLGWWQEGRTKENSRGSGIRSNIIGTSLGDIIGNRIGDGLVSAGSLLLLLKKDSWLLLFVDYYKRRWENGESKALVEWITYELLYNMIVNNDDVM